MDAGTQVTITKLDSLIGDLTPDNLLLSSTFVKKVMLWAVAPVNSVMRVVVGEVTDLDAIAGLLPSANTCLIFRIKPIEVSPRWKVAVSVTGVLTCTQQAQQPPRQKTVSVGARTHVHEQAGDHT